MYGKVVPAFPFSWGASLPHYLADWIRDFIIPGHCHPRCPSGIAVLHGNLDSLGGTRLVNVSQSKTTYSSAITSFKVILSLYNYTIRKMPINKIDQFSKSASSNVNKFYSPIVVIRRLWKKHQLLKSVLRKSPSQTLTIFHNRFFQRTNHHHTKIHVNIVQHFHQPT